MNLIQKYGKKKVCIISSILAVVCIIVGVTTWYVMEENYKQKVLDSIDVTFVEEAILEYGSELDFNTFIEERKGEPEVTLPIVEINTKELGTTQVTYILSKDGYSKNSTLEIEVKDTQAPVITLKEDSVTLEYESEYDIKSNVESVIDPVDGEIPFAESAGENAYYTIEGSVDTSSAGEYTITIKAVDKNNLASEKTFIVNVNEKKEVKAPVQPQSGGNKAPVSNNGAGSSNSGTSNPPVQPNGIGSVINTAYSFVGGSMSCNDVVIKAYRQNGYQVSDSAYYLGNSVGTNVDNIIAGDVIVLSGHVMLVVSKNGTDIIVVEGGVNGNNIEVTNCVGQGNLFYHNGVSERQVIDIRRY